MCDTQVMQVRHLMTEMGSTPIQPSELSSQRFSSITLDEMNAIAALKLAPTENTSSRANFAMHYSRQ